MIEAAVVAEIVRLLGSGMSKRAVAQQCDVSRATVQAVAQARHPHQLRLGSAALKPAGEPHLIDDGRPTGRCPTCGRMVKLPCTWCQVQRQPKAAAAQQEDEANGQPSAVDQMIAAPESLQNFYRKKRQERRREYVRGLRAMRDRQHSDSENETPDSDSEEEP